MLTVLQHQRPYLYRYGTSLVGLLFLVMVALSEDNSALQIPQTVELTGRDGLLNTVETNSGNFINAIYIINAIHIGTNPKLHDDHALSLQYAYDLPAKNLPQNASYWIDYHLDYGLWRRVI